MDLVVEPHVGHRHAVLGQRARLVGADGGGGAESLHGLQVLHQAVLLGHSLGSESQAHLRGRRVVMEEKKEGWEEERRGEEEGELLVNEWREHMNAAVHSSVCASETTRGAGA